MFSHLAGALKVDGRIEQTVFQTDVASLLELEKGMSAIEMMRHPSFAVSYALPSHRHLRARWYQ
jgi:sensor domain CHASE-containing protein